MSVWHVAVSSCVEAALQALLFSKDFKKHCEAAELIRDALHTLGDEVLAVLDLLFRCDWVNM